MIIIILLVNTEKRDKQRNAQFHKRYVLFNTTI